MIKSLPLRIPMPAGICSWCFENSLMTHSLSAGSPVLVSYCIHQQAGGVIQWNLPEMRWIIFTPVDQAGWKHFITEAICDVIEADWINLFDEQTAPLDPSDKTKVIDIDRWRVLRRR